MGLLLGYRDDLWEKPGVRGYSKMSPTPKELHQGRSTGCGRGLHGMVLGSVGAGDSSCVFADQGQL